MFKIKKVTLNEINIVTFLLMISPIIDNINGFLLLNGIEAGISSLYKSLLLFIFLIALLFAKHKYLKKTVLAICVLAFLLIASFLYSMFVDVTGISTNINTTIRLLMPFVMCFYYMERFNNEQIQMSVKAIFKFYMCFYPLSLIIPSLLGIGFDTYSTGVGSKGFYYAGNEISAIMIVLCFYCVKNYLVGKKKGDLLLLVLNLCATVFIGTKSVYLALAFVLAVYVVSNIMKRNKIIQMGFISLFLIIMVLVLYKLNQSFFEEIIRSWNDNYEFHIKDKYENEMVAFLLSTRNGTLEDAINVFKSNCGELSFLFGTGNYFMTVRNDLLIEMDGFDLFFWYGGLTGGYIVCVIIASLIKFWKKYNIYAKTLFLTMGGFSFLAGHVLFAPSVMMVVVLFFLYVSFECIQNKE